MSPRRPSRTDAVKRRETQLLTKRLLAARDADRPAKPVRAVAAERRGEEQAL